MNEISCNVCMDLIPLVQDGIASEDSRQAVEQHIKSCPACAALYSGTVPPSVDSNRLLEKVQRKTQFFFLLLLMLGIFFGLGLTASNEMFYNTLLMPVIGILGYLIFRWKAVYEVPLLILFTNLVSFLMNQFRGMEELGLYSRVVWTGLYSIFVVAGVVIAGLLHYAIRKE